MATSLVTSVRNLQRRKSRKRSKLAVAEGVRVVEEALAAGVPMRGAIVAPSLGATPRGAALLAELAGHAIEIEEVADSLFGQLAHTDTPQGVIALLEPPRWDLGQIRPAPGAPVLILDGVQDPGNVGALLRTAFALGAAGAVLLKGTADPNSPKVIRAAMGATFRLPTAPTDEAALAAWCARYEVTVWAAALEGTPVRRLSPPERLALAIGNEGAGVGRGVKELAERQVTIPLARGAESLNVAVAAGIILYEVARAS